MLNKILLSICFIVLIFSATDLISRDYGGYTDPITPNRHSRVNIDSANIVVIPHGIYAEISIEFWFRSVDYNKSTDTLEFYNGFYLPVTDFINDNWLWVEDTMVNAMIIDVNTATLIYEDIVHRQHKDPSILYRRNTDGFYEYRIFPNVGNKSRHAKYSYYTKMYFENGKAYFEFTPAVINLSVNQSIPLNIKFYLNNNFTDMDFGVYPVNYSNDEIGKYIEMKTSYTFMDEIYYYSYDFSTPYFSKSNRIDDQEYYFSMFDSKSLLSSYINQKINFLIDYDVNRTSITAKSLIDQLKKAILSNFSSGDSINLMIGGKNTINLFNRWIPCDKDTINLLLDSTISNQVSLYSYLADLMYDGVGFNAQFDDNSSIILLTSSEYAPTPTSANPIIQNCLNLMPDKIYKISTIDFSDIHYSTYTINSLNYYGDEYFNEKIAELTKGEIYSVKETHNTVYGMLNAAFTEIKGSISDVGLYIEPADGITIAKTTENIIDNNSNTNLIYEFGKIEGDYPIVAKLSALLDGKPVIKKYSYSDTNIIINDESAKMWNWKYLRYLEDKYNKTKKESNDLVNRSITNRILTTQTAFLCLEPWMMHQDNAIEDPSSTSVQEEIQEAGLEITYGPNPIKNNLFVNINITNDYTKILFIGIYDVLGNLIKEFKVDDFSNEIKLNWDTYSDNYGKVQTGVYYLIVKTNTGRKTLKLVIL